MRNLLLLVIIILGGSAREMCKFHLSDDAYFFVIAASPKDCLNKTYVPISKHGYCVKGYVCERASFENCINGHTIQKRSVGYDPACRDEDDVIYDAYDSYPEPSLYF